MTDTDNLVLEQLRLIRKDVGELKEGQVQIRIEISALGQQLAGLATGTQDELPTDSTQLPPPNAPQVPG